MIATWLQILIRFLTGRVIFEPLNWVRYSHLGVNDFQDTCLCPMFNFSGPGWLRSAWRVRNSVVLSWWCFLLFFQYYLYELSGGTAVERPRQIHPYVIVAFQYREPKKMAAPAPKSMWVITCILCFPGFVSFALIKLLLCFFFPLDLNSVKMVSYLISSFKFFFFLSKCFVHKSTSFLPSFLKVLISPWKGKLIIQGCLLCDITLWSSYGTLVSAQL